MFLLCRALEGMDSIPGWETKIPEAAWHGQKKYRRRRASWLLLLFSHSVMSSSFVTLWAVVFQAPLSMEFPSKNIGVATSFSRSSSWPRDWTLVSYIGRWILYYWATWEAPSRQTRARYITSTNTELLWWSHGEQILRAQSLILSFRVKSLKMASSWEIRGELKRMTENWYWSNLDIQWSLKIFLNSNFSKRKHVFLYLRGWRWVYLWENILGTYRTSEHILFVLLTLRSWSNKGKGLQSLTPCGSAIPGTELISEKLAWKVTSQFSIFQSGEVT